MPVECEPESGLLDGFAAPDEHPHSCVEVRGSFVAPVLTLWLVPHTEQHRLMESSGQTTTSDVSWRQVVAAVAAAAGGAAWVSAVGSGVVALRLRQADLPIEPVVALMSPEHRFAVGAGILVAPLLAGTIGFLADWGFGKQVGPRKRELAAAGTVLAATALVYFLLEPPLKTLLFQAVAVAVTVPIAFEFLPDDREKRHGFTERLVVFLWVSCHECG